MLAGIRERAGAAGILLDFDGSLAPIVARPEVATATAGAHEVLERLARRYRLVAVISGRTSGDLTERLGGVNGLTLVGLYGMQDAAPDLATAVLPLVERAANTVPAAWVEDKGYRSPCTTEPPPIPRPRGVCSSPSSTPSPASRGSSSWRARWCWSSFRGIVR